MIVTKAWLAAMTLAIGFAAVSCNSGPEAHADTPGITCEHRGGAHIERHGGKVEDDTYHRLHHERLTCDDHGDGKDFAPYERHEADRHADSDDDDKDTKHDDTPLPGHRDKPGYGCFLLRCG